MLTPYAKAHLTLLAIRNRHDALARTIKIAPGRDRYYIAMYGYLTASAVGRKALRNILADQKAFDCIHHAQSSSS